ncbi:hypothetical protein [Saccharothrix xinjiangensis]|uniref:Apea-like HEPN domain-containing protein n=1 Tax=Saccharothrix xinjiangensis TaxID=204798 RepID=A0ABV9Y0H8_9PSEU
MRYRGFDAQLSERLDACSADQAHLVQRVLGGVEPTAIHSRHASALAGLVTELPRLHAALTHHHEVGQPQKHLVDKLCENALRRLPVVVEAWGEEVLAPIEALLVGVRAAIAEGPGDGSRDHTGTILEPLRLAVAALDDVLADRFARVWESPDGSLDLVADEVACLLARADRDPVAAEQDLARLTRWDADAVWRTLLPAPAPHRAALVVRGTSALADLEVFDPTADQSPLRSAHRMRWGPATNRLRAFVEHAPPGGEACVVSLVVSAVDRPSAARRARRALAELLDQYTAGTRLLTLAVDARVLVNRVGGPDTEEWRPADRGTPIARPLTRRELPEEVRRALRMAHVAVGAPAVASALAWSALEACGLVRRADLAAALAVQSLRQEVVGAYRVVRQSASARLDQARVKARLARRTAAQRRRALDRCPPDHPHRPRLADLLAAAEADPAERDLAALTDLVATSLAAIGGHARHDERHHLRDLNTWTDLLRPPARDPEPLVTARTALDALLPVLHPAARRQVEQWRARLADPALLAAWVRERTERMTTVVDSLYATRNLTLHSGLVGDEAVHGVGAVMVTDLALELLGNWYGNARGEEAALPPEAVIAVLARRRHDMLSRLHRQAKPGRLDFARLTSPGPDGVWRR